VENELEVDGVPIVEVTNWDDRKNELEFNFCYPIKFSNNLPLHPTLRYKWLEGQEAIKATYNGNYITSDRAWYALMNYARRNDIEHIDKPVEFFYENPNIADRNELTWKAEIFLPIKRNGR
jgi:effector-binding domain-containing protein